MLKFELNVEERKTLAKRMEELTGIHPYYTKAPRYAYDIGNYTCLLYTSPSPRDCS